MGKEDSMTPQLLICAFRDKRFDTSREAIVAFRKLEPSLQKKFLQPIIDFLKSEEHDNIRGWGTSVLESIGNAKAFEYLNTLLTSADDDQKKRYPWTRFFALRAIRRIAKKSSHEMVSKLLKEIENSPDENLLVSTEATIIRALDGNEKSEREMRDLLDKLLSKGVHRMNYYKCFCIVRGLQEFALPGLVNSIMDIAANCDIPDLQNRAVRALG
ncbi:MAG: hypothetical protein OEW48_09265, partial [Phycisphaerae bacterium]|nr:hypothetical protein [Phycisphaerae bacterium]